MQVDQVYRLLSKLLNDTDAKKILYLETRMKIALFVLYGILAV